MSVRADRVFLPTLRALERELPLPIPERVRVLRELEFDLEELRSSLEAGGASHEEARARALEILAPDGRTMGELGRLHTPMYARLTRGLHGDVLRLIERGALAATGATVLVIEARLLLGVDLLAAPSPFLWVVLGLGALLFAQVAAKAFELWIRRDHRAPERGLGAILALTAAVVATALAGGFIELYGLLSELEAGSAPPAALAFDWLVRSSGLLAVAVLIAMIGALSWFVMAHWLALVDGARRELLGIAALPERLPPSTTR